MEMSANMDQGFILYSNILSFCLASSRHVCLLLHKSKSHIMTKDGIFAKIQAKCTLFYTVTPIKEH